MENESWVVVKEKGMVAVVVIGLVLSVISLLICVSCCIVSKRADEKAKAYFGN